MPSALRPGFAVFILSHGRPEYTAQKTVASLTRHGYTGPWFVVLDDEDDTAERYEELFPGRVRYFTKNDDAQDMGDNGGNRGVIIYARNAVEGIAEAEKLTHYMQLDDDYEWFEIRHQDEVGSLRSHAVQDLNEVANILTDFLEESGALTVAMAQGGDFIGGIGSAVWKRRLSRKAMNSFVSRVGRPPRFVGRINEDVNTYVLRGGQGELIFTPADVSLVQADTQSQAGGMTGVYTDLGTYTKSFYTVMMNPASVVVTVVRDRHYRIHHRINWNRAVPKIISSRWRKPCSTDSGS